MNEYIFIKKILFNSLWNSVKKYFDSDYKKFFDIVWEIIEIIKGNSDEEMIGRLLVISFALEKGVKLDDISYLMKFLNSYNFYFEAYDILPSGLIDNVINILENRFPRRRGILDRIFKSYRISKYLMKRYRKLEYEELNSIARNLGVNDKGKIIEIARSKGFLVNYQYIIYNSRRIEKEIRDIIERGEIDCQEGLECYVNKIKKSKLVDYPEGVIRLVLVKLGQDGVIRL